MWSNFKSWFNQNIIFISWGWRFWPHTFPMMYIHFIPIYSVRVWFFGIDWRKKQVFRQIEIEEKCH